jgi:glycosyltransferase involved in cell wall biosynthesis
MQLFYISNGNIPSRWAHTVQTMKMSEAFSKLIPGFALLIATDLPGLLTTKRRVFRWYGIQRRFPLHRLVIARRFDAELLQRQNVPEFADHARHYVQSVNPSVVYSRNHRSALYALEDGFPVIFETHDGPGNPKTMRYIRQFGAFSNLRGIVTTSPILRDAFSAEGVPTDRILVRGNAVDLARFQSISEDPAACRQRLGLSPEQHLVIYTGSLKPHKGIGTLIGAARLLPEVQFLVVGGSTEEIDSWRAQGPENLRFQPFVPNAELPRWLRAADVCVVPNSRTDRTAAWTFSLKLYEYLAACRPIIASDIPSLRSIVADGEEALLVPPDEPQALADAIVRLMSDPSLSSRLTTAGFDKVAGLTWSRRAAEILDELAPELKRRRRRAEAVAS